jgi:hypothetical protein|tara:strand:+ start:127 stop:390 length:264 start_codon:yes stop_codon:yes gene_type:complete
MIKFICNKCNDTLELTKAIIKNIEGKWRTEDAYCKKCNEWMQELEKDFNGFPSLIRTEPSLSKRGDKLWASAKEKLTGEKGINEPFK